MDNSYYKNTLSCLIEICSVLSDVKYADKRKATASSVRTESSHSSSKATYSYVRFEVSMAVAMKNVVFWYVAPCGSCKNRRFGGKYRLHHQQASNNDSNN
jgi:hypothetical protein